MGIGALFSGFVNGYQVGDKILNSREDREYKKLRRKALQQKMDKDADPERNELEKDLLRSRAQRYRAINARDPELSANRKRQGVLLDMQIEDAKKAREAKPAPSAADDAGALLPPNAAPNSGEASPEMMESAGFDQPEGADNDGLDYEPDDDFDDQGEAFAKGGIVEGFQKHVADRFHGRPRPKMTPPPQLAGPKQALPVGYAEGGAVDDEEDAPELQAVDPNAEADQQEMVDASEDTDAGDEEAEPASYSPAALKDAVQAAQATTQRNHGIHPDQSRREGVATDFSAARRQGASMANARGNGAASVDEVQAVLDKIDPGHRLSDSQRSSAAMAHIWQWKLQRGDTRGAQQAAAALYQGLRVKSDLYRAMGRAAAENGDVQGTIKGMVKAYGSVPDGQDLRIAQDPKDPNRLQYSLTDQDGNVVTKNIISPQELLQWATKGQIPDFDSLAGQAGVKLEKPAKGAAGAGKGAGDGTRKTTDRLKDDELLEKAGIAEAPDEFKTLASQVLHDNDISPKEAAAITKVLTNSSTEGRYNADGVWVGADGKPKDPAAAEAPKFRITARTEAGGAQITLAGGRTVKLSKSAFDNMIAARGMAKRDADAVETKGIQSRARAYSENELTKKVGALREQRGLNRPTERDLRLRNQAIPLD